MGEGDPKVPEPSQRPQSSLLRRAGRLAAAAGLAGVMSGEPVRTVHAQDVDQPQAELALKGLEALPFPGAKEFADAIAATSPDDDFFASRALEFAKSAASENGWNPARTLVLRHKGNMKAIEFAFRLKGARLADPVFHASFDRYVRAKLPKAASMMHADDELQKDFVHEQLRRPVREMSLNDYLVAIDNPKFGPAIREILGESRQKAFTAPILKMNDLHNGSAAERLNVLKGFNSRILFEIMLSGGSDAYLSTFRLIYYGNDHEGKETRHSFSETVKREHGSMRTFLSSIHLDPRTFGRFLEYLSDNDVIDSFLNDIGSPSEQKELLREYLFDAKTGITKELAVPLSDLLHVSENVEVREFVLSNLRRLWTGTASDDASKKVAGLVLAEYFREKRDDATDADRAALDAFEKYFPNITSLSGSAVFREEGTINRNVQLHAFYDDRKDHKGVWQPQKTWDGHISFKNFMESLGSAVGWDSRGKINRISRASGVDIQDRNQYLVITRRSGNREIVMYVLKPDLDEKVALELNETLAAKHEPHFVTHRGHSYHAWKTLLALREGVTLMNFGSCGGSKLTGHVLSKLPNAHIIGTRNMGTVLVNDRRDRILDNALLMEGRLDYLPLQTTIDREFAKVGGEAEERLQGYFLPFRNRPAHLIAAINAATKTGQ